MVLITDFATISTIHALKIIDCNIKAQPHIIIFEMKSNETEKKIIIAQKQVSIHRERVQAGIQFSYCRWHRHIGKANELKFPTTFRIIFN